MTDWIVSNWPGEYGNRRGEPFRNIHSPIPLCSRLTAPSLRNPTMATTAPSDYVCVHKAVSIPERPRP